jgi:hypothetical protein
LTPTEQVEFLTEISAVREVLRRCKRFYVYVLHRPDGTPFYVGKGIDDRVLDHVAEARNTMRLSHKLNVIRSLYCKGLRVGYRIDGSYEDEVQAHNRERYLIRTIGRHDLKRGPLTNQTDGGEGTSNPSEESRQRRRDSLWGENADDLERQTANRYFQRLCSVQSVTLKPTRTWKRAASLYRNRDTLQMYPRQAATLAASAISNRVMLEPCAVLPRHLIVDGIDLIIENGVGRDMLSSEMVTLADETPTFEKLCLTERGFRYILEALELSMLIDAGVLSPDLDKERLDRAVE